MDVESASPLFDQLVPRDAVVERISDGHLFTEGPVWDAREGALLWVDIAGDAIWRWKPGEGRSVFMHPSGKANGLTFDRAGRLVAAGWTSRCVWRLGADGRRETLATHYGGLKIGTPNDIVVRSDGTIYWTDGTSGARHPGFETAEDIQIYRRESLVLRVKPGGDVELATGDAGSCNGIAFSHDEKILYVNDSSARNLRAFDVATDGSLSNGRVFAEQTGSATKVDARGHVFCTGKGGVQVRDPRDGSLLGRIIVPGHLSNLAWGDRDWRTLFVTGDGAVYRVRLSTTGVAV